VRVKLFDKADREGYSRQKIAVRDIKTTIFGHKEFTAFNQSITKLFEKWQQRHLSRLRV
jgi:type I restriction enzyme M protein